MGIFYFGFTVCGAASEMQIEIEWFALTYRAKLPNMPH